MHVPHKTLIGVFKLFMAGRTIWIRIRHGALVASAWCHTSTSHLGRVEDSNLMSLPHRVRMKIEDDGILLSFSKVASQFIDSGIG